MTNTYYGAIWTRYNMIPEPQYLKLRRELAELRKQVQETKRDTKTPEENFNLTFDVKARILDI